MNWWKEQPLIISAVQCNYGKDESEREIISERILNEYTIGYRFNAEQLFHLTPTGIESSTGRKLDRYIKKSRKAGIREIFYINIHSMFHETYSEHPDWVQTDPDGKPLMAYDIYPFICIRSGWRDYIKKCIDGLCKRDIDGIFLDGPVMQKCPSCYAQHKSIYAGLACLLWNSEYEKNDRGLERLASQKDAYVYLEAMEETEDEGAESHEAWITRVESM